MIPRIATAPEVATILSWAASEGWNPGIDDAAAFHATDPEGFFVAEVDGAPVAAISVVNHTDDLAFLGLYLCLPEHRGKGIGYALWQHALAHAGDRVVGLDGVPDQQANYRKSGFAAAGETYRYEGRFAPHVPPGLRPALDSDLPTLAGMEAQANGYAKPAFLNAWLADTPTRRTHVLEQGGDIAAFATARQCADRVKIGPLVSRDIDAARDLLSGIATTHSDGKLVIDVPDDQIDLTRLCFDAGLEVSFNTARMYRGAAPTPGKLIRSIATLELG